MNNLALVFIIGLAAGVLGGFFGIAGGVIIVPALIFLLGMPTHTAVGTSLGALLPPVGFLGALVYYRQSALDIHYALLLAAGMLLGAGCGAIVASGVSNVLLTRLFAVLLVLVAARLWFN